MIPNKSCGKSQQVGFLNQLWMSYWIRHG